MPSGTASTANPFTTVQTLTNNPTRVVTLDITAEVDGEATNIANLRPEDFIITSDDGQITPSLT